MQLFGPPAFALALLTLSAQGVVVNFDFNRNTGDNTNIGIGAAGDTYQGLGAAADSASNTFWNSVRRSSSNTVSSASGLNNNVTNGGPIRDSSGAATNIDVLLSATTSAAGTTAMGQQRSSVSQQEMGSALGYEDLMADFLQLNAPGADSAGNLGTINGTINGLVANGLYELFFYGQGASYGLPGSTTSGANSFFAITSTLGGSIIGTGKQTGWDGTNGGDGALVEGVEFVKFSAVANASGEIFFIWQNVIVGVNVTTDAATDSTGGSSDLAALNAIQVVSVPAPEPSAFLLTALGALGLLRRRR